MRFFICVLLFGVVGLVGCQTSKTKMNVHITRATKTFWNGGRAGVHGEKFDIYISPTVGWQPVFTKLQVSGETLVPKLQSSKNGNHLVAILSYPHQEENFGEAAPVKSELNTQEGVLWYRAANREKSVKVRFTVNENLSGEELIPIRKD